jgi:hypothetical protein
VQHSNIFILIKSNHICLIHCLVPQCDPDMNQAAPCYSHFHSTTEKNCPNNNNMDAFFLVQNTPLLRSNPKKTHKVQHPLACQSSALRWESGWTIQQKKMEVTSREMGGGGIRVVYQSGDWVTYRRSDAPRMTW